MVSVYSKADNRVLNAEKAILSCCGRRIGAGFFASQYHPLASTKIQGKSIAAQALFSLYSSIIATSFQAIDTHSQCDIIQESKMQTQSSPWLDKRLHFPFLKKGAMPSATDYPPVHNCTLIISYRTGGNNQLGPQEEAHQQFRYSAARD